MFSKKAVDGTVEDTEAAKEGTKLLTVSTPLICSSSPLLYMVYLSKSLLSTYINLIAVDFLWSDVPLLSVPARIFQRMLLTWSTLEVLV